MKLNMTAKQSPMKSAPPPPGIKAGKSKGPRLARPARKRTKPNLQGKGVNMDSAHVPFVMDGYRGV